MQNNEKREIISRYFEDRGHYVQFDVTPMFQTMHYHGVDVEQFYVSLDDAIKYINLNLLTKDLEVTLETQNMFYYLYIVRDMLNKMQVNH